MEEKIDSALEPLPLGRAPLDYVPENEEDDFEFDEDDGAPLTEAQQAVAFLLRCKPELESLNLTGTSNEIRAVLEVLAQRAPKDQILDPGGLLIDFTASMSGAEKQTRTAIFAGCAAQVVARRYRVREQRLVSHLSKLSEMVPRKMTLQEFKDIEVPKPEEQLEYHLDLRGPQRIAKSGRGATIRATSDNQPALLSPCTGCICIIKARKDGIPAKLHRDPTTLSFYIEYNTRYFYALQQQANSFSCVCVDSAPGQLAEICDLPNMVCVSTSTETSVPVPFQATKGMMRVVLPREAEQQLRYQCKADKSFAGTVVHVCRGFNEFNVQYKDYVDNGVALDDLLSVELEPAKLGPNEVSESCLSVLDSRELRFFLNTQLFNEKVTNAQELVVNLRCAIAAQSIDSLKQCRFESHEQIEQAEQELLRIGAIGSATRQLPVEPLARAVQAIVAKALMQPYNPVEFTDLMAIKHPDLLELHEPVVKSTEAVDLNDPIYQRSPNRVIEARVAHYIMHLQEIGFPELITLAYILGDDVPKIALSDSSSPASKSALCHFRFVLDMFLMFSNYVDFETRNWAKEGQKDMDSDMLAIVRIPLEPGEDRDERVLVYQDTYTGGSKGTAEQKSGKATIRGVSLYQTLHFEPKDPPKIAVQSRCQTIRMSLLMQTFGNLSDSISTLSPDIQKGEFYQGLKQIVLAQLEKGQCKYAQKGKAAMTTARDMNLVSEVPFCPASSVEPQLPDPFSMATYPRGMESYAPIRSKNLMDEILRQPFVLDYKRNPGEEEVLALIAVPAQFGATSCPALKEAMFASVQEVREHKQNDLTDFAKKLGDVGCGVAEAIFCNASYQREDYPLCYQDCGVQTEPCDCTLRVDCGAEEGVEVHRQERLKALAQEVIATKCSAPATAISDMQFELNTFKYATRGLTQRKKLEGMPSMYIEDGIVYMPVLMSASKEREVVILTHLTQGNQKKTFCYSYWGEEIHPLTRQRTGAKVLRRFRSEQVTQILWLQSQIGFAHALPTALTRIQPGTRKVAGKRFSASQVTVWEMILAQYYPSVTLTAALSLFKYALQGCVGSSQVDDSFQKVRNLVVQKGLFGPYLMSGLMDTIVSFKKMKELGHRIDSQRPFTIESVLLPQVCRAKDIAEYASVLSWYMPDLGASFKGTMEVATNQVSLALDQERIDASLRNRSFEVYECDFLTREDTEVDSKNEKECEKARKQDNAKARDARLSECQRILDHLSAELVREEQQTEGIGEDWVSNAQRSRPYLVYCLSVLRRLEEGQGHPSLDTRKAVIDSFSSTPYSTQAGSKAQSKFGSTKSDLSTTVQLEFMNCSLTKYLHETFPEGKSGQYYNMLIVQWIKESVRDSGRYNILITVKDQPGSYRVISIQDIEKVNQQTIDAVFAKIATKTEGNAIVSDNKMLLLQQQFAQLRSWSDCEEVFYFPGDCSKFGDSVQPELLYAIAAGFAIDEGFFRQVTRDFIADFHYKRILLPRFLKPYTWSPRDEVSTKFRQKLNQAEDAGLYDPMTFSVESRIGMQQGLLNAWSSTFQALVYYALQLHLNRNSVGADGRVSMLATSDDLSYIFAGTLSQCQMGYSLLLFLMQAIGIWLNQEKTFIQSGKGNTGFFTEFNALFYSIDSARKVTQCTCGTKFLIALLQYKGYQNILERAYEYFVGVQMLAYFGSSSEVTAAFRIAMQEREDQLYKQLNYPKCDTKAVLVIPSLLQLHYWLPRMTKDCPRNILERYILTISSRGQVFSGHSDYNWDALKQQVQQDEACWFRTTITPKTAPPKFAQLDKQIATREPVAILNMESMSESELISKVNNDAIQLSKTRGSSIPIQYKALSTTSADYRTYVVPAIGFEVRTAAELEKICLQEYASKLVEYQAGCQLAKSVQFCIENSSTVEYGAPQQALRVYDDWVVRGAIQTAKARMMISGGFDPKLLGPEFKSNSGKTDLSYDFANSVSTLSPVLLCNRTIMCREWDQVESVAQLGRLNKGYSSYIELARKIDKALDTSLLIQEQGFSSEKVQQRLVLTPSGAIYTDRPELYEQTRQSLLVRSRISAALFPRIMQDWSDSSLDMYSKSLKNALSQLVSGAPIARRIKRVDGSTEEKFLLMNQRLEGTFVTLVDVDSQPDVFDHIEGQQSYELIDYSRRERGLNCVFTTNSVILPLNVPFNSNETKVVYCGPYGHKHRAVEEYSLCFQPLAKVETSLQQRLIEEFWSVAHEAADLNQRLPTDSLWKAAIVMYFSNAIVPENVFIPAQLFKIVFTMVQPKPLFATPQEIMRLPELMDGVPAFAAAVSTCTEVAVGQQSVPFLVRAPEQREVPKDMQGALKKLMLDIFEPEELIVKELYGTSACIAIRGAKDIRIMPPRVHRTPFNKVSQVPLEKWSQAHLQRLTVRQAKAFFEHSVSHAHRRSPMAYHAWACRTAFIRQDGTIEPRMPIQDSLVGDRSEGVPEGAWRGWLGIRKVLHRYYSGEDHVEGEPLRTFEEFLEMTALEGDLPYRSQAPPGKTSLPLRMGISQETIEAATRMQALQERKLEKAKGEQGLRELYNLAKQRIDEEE